MRHFFLFSLIYFVTIITSNSFAASPLPVMAKQGMVVSEHYLASEVGIDVLRAGGNAIDAAVAVGYALAVVNPCCGNIGGGGFMTIHLANGQDIFLNFREKAPLAAKANMYSKAKENSLRGYLAVAIPGTVLGLETALKKYGTWSNLKVMAPAIRLAEQGFVLSPAEASILRDYAPHFKAEANVANIFLNHHQPYQAGDLLIQTDLAHTLKQIASNGSAAFYKGPIAKKIVAASQAHGGILSLADFSTYHVEELSPIRCNYRGYQIISAPPPSSGGITLCEAIHILENYPLSYLGYHSAQSVHYIVEALRYAFFDRNHQLGDPNFVKNPVDRLISPAYALTIREKIQDFHATSSQDLGQADSSQKISTHTTHYSIVDKQGNAVSVTYTLNSYFGAGVIAGDTGFFLNNEMDDFTTHLGESNQFGLIQTEPNAIQPGKRPLSSMTPTIIMKNGRLFLVLGSPGGPRIITATLQTILNVIDYGMNIQEAVDAPRFHHQWLPNTIDIEPWTLSADTMEKLAMMGYHFTPRNQWSAVEAILIDPTTHTLYGGSDSRRPLGKAIGY